MQKGNLGLKCTKNQVSTNDTTQVKYKFFKTALKYSTSVNVCGFFVDQDTEKVKERQGETITSKSTENCTKKKTAILFSTQISKNNKNRAPEISLSF